MIYHNYVNWSIQINKIKKIKVSYSKFFFPSRFLNFINATLIDPSKISSTKTSPSSIVVIRKNLFRSLVLSINQPESIDYLSVSCSDAQHIRVLVRSFVQGLLDHHQCLQSHASPLLQRYARQTRAIPV